MLQIFGRVFVDLCPFVTLIRVLRELCELFIMSQPVEQGQRRQEQGLVAENIVQCAALFYERGKSGSNYLGKEKFRAVLKNCK